MPTGKDGPYPASTTEPQPMSTSTAVPKNSAINLFMRFAPMVPRRSADRLSEFASNSPGSHGDEARHHSNKGQTGASKSAQEHGFPPTSRCGLGWRNIVKIRRRVQIGGSGTSSRSFEGYQCQ